MCSDSVCVKLSLFSLSSIVGFVRSAGGWLCGYPLSSLAFRYHSSHKWRSDIKKRILDLEIKVRFT